MFLETKAPRLEHVARLHPSEYALATLHDEDYPAAWQDPKSEDATRSWMA